MTARETALLAALLVPFWVASILGLPEALGAHPWWATRSGVVGSLIGAAGVLGWRLMFKDARLFPWVALLGLTGSALAAFWGKQMFVASFAENALAGRYWFFSWFGLSACLYALVAALLFQRFRR